MNKDIKDLHREFEKTETFDCIAIRDDFYFREDWQCYATKSTSFDCQLAALNGAWEMFQELHK